MEENVGDKVLGVLSSEIPTPEISKKPSRRCFKIILFCILGLVLVGESVFIIYRLFRKEGLAERQVNPLSMITPNLKPLLRSIPLFQDAKEEILQIGPATNSWETYTSKRYGYSIKYPANLFLKNPIVDMFGEEQVILGEKEVTEEGKYEISLPKPFFIEESRVKYDESLDFYVWLESYEWDPLNEENFKSGNLRARKLKVNGINVAVIYGESGSSPMIEICIEDVQNKRILLLGLIGFAVQDYTPSSVFPEQRILEEMLSTFKFLD